jgi:hypothetical protein
MNFQLAKVRAREFAEKLKTCIGPKTRAPSIDYPSEYISRKPRILYGSIRSDFIIVEKPSGKKKWMK